MKVSSGTRCTVWFQTLFQDKIHVNKFNKQQMRLHPLQSPHLNITEQSWKDFSFLLFLFSRKVKKYTRFSSGMIADICLRILKSKRSCSSLTRHLILILLWLLATCLLPSKVHDPVCLQIKCTSVRRLICFMY